jgi:cytochrome c peroxidase
LRSFKRAAVRAVRAAAAGWIAVILSVPATAARPQPGGQSVEARPGLIALGRKVFFDTRLSLDGTISCASCHRPDTAFADARATSLGVHAQAGTRNAPSLLNVNQHRVFLWDGRRESLEDQVLQPFTNPIEHGLADASEISRRIQTFRDYQRPLTQALGRRARASSSAIATALGAYIRSLQSSRTRFDEYWESGEPTALTESERRGLGLFRGAADCSSCHLVEPKSATFTDDKFHSVGIGKSKPSPEMASAAVRASALSRQDVDRLVVSDGDIAALGRFNVTKKPGDIGQYRTPSLRNVARTAPYMHDGSISTLEEAVDLEIYYRSVQRGRTIVLTAQEKADVVAFLRSLSTNTTAKP